MTSEEAGQSPQADVEEDDPQASEDDATLLSAVTSARSALGVGPINNVTVINGSVHGSVTGGDHVAGSAQRRESRLSAGPVDRIRLVRLAATFVEPPGFDDAVAALSRSSLLILRGPAGCGRTAAALRLLHSQCADGVSSLDPDTVLVAAELPALRRGHGYIVSSAPHRLSALTDFAADDLRRHLDGADARLVVIADDDAPLRAADLGEWLRTLDTPPRIADVVERRLRWLLAPEFGEDDAADRGAALLADPAAAAELAELASAPVRDAELFADELERVATGRAMLSDVLARRGAAAASRFFERFDNEFDVQTRALTIALAAFNAMPAHEVDRIAGDLADRFAAVGEPAARPARAPFGRPQRQRLAEVAAQLVDGEEQTPHGSVATRFARFTSVHFPRRVLTHVWLEHPGARGVLVEWLGELGRDASYTVRIRAGVAVGVLSLVGFDHLRRCVIEPWADSGTVRQRQAVIGALQEPAEDPDLGVIVGRMTKDWLSAHSTPARRRAAAHVLGSIGAAAPEQALALLRRALLSDAALAPTAASSVAQLFLREAVRPLVLDALLRWTASEHLAVRRAGLLAFLSIAAESRIDDGRGGAPWPAVVWLAEHGSWSEEMADLLERALDDGFTMRRAYAVLGRWVGLAEREPALLSPLARLLAEVVLTSGDPESMRFYMDGWLDDAAASPRTRRLLTACSEGRTAV